MTDRAFDAEHIELWRAEIARADDVPLGAFNWPVIFGKALDEVKRLTEDNAELATKLEALREHALDSNPALRTLHNNAVAYLDAVNALHEVTGAPLSTTIGYLIRQRFLAIVPTAEAIEAGKNAERSDRAEVKRLTAIVEAVERVRILIAGAMPSGDATDQYWVSARDAFTAVDRQLAAALSSVPGLSEASGDLG